MEPYTDSLGIEDSGACTRNEYQPQEKKEKLWNCIIYLIILSYCHRLKPVL